MRIIFAGSLPAPLIVSTILSEQRSTMTTVSPQHHFSVVVTSIGALPRAVKLNRYEVLRTYLATPLEYFNMEEIDWLDSLACSLDVDFTPQVKYSLISCWPVLINRQSESQAFNDKDWPTNICKSSTFALKFMKPKNRPFHLTNLYLSNRIEVNFFRQCS